MSPCDDKQLIMETSELPVAEERGCELLVLRWWLSGTVSKELRPRRAKSQDVRIGGICLVSQSCSFDIISKKNPNSTLTDS